MGQVIFSIKAIIERKSQIIFSLTLSLVISLVNSNAYDQDKLAPIILVHGISDSQIIAKYHTHGHPKGCEEKSEGPGGWEHMWKKFDLATNGDHYQRCWAYRFKLLYDRNAHRCTNQIGVQTLTKGKLGSLKCCEYLTETPVTQLSPLSKYFHDIKKALKKKGYSTDHSLKAHCYDWRYAPPQLAEQGYFNRYTELVEKMAADTKRKVAIVGHSMGGLVSTYFLLNKTQEWKNKHIHALITVGTPWLGSMKSVGNYIVGTNQGVFTINKKIMKKLMRTFQSAAYLLPQEEAFKDTVIVEWVPKNKTYTSLDYKQFFTDVGWEDGYLMRQDLRYLFPVPLDQLGVKYHCVWANYSKLETPETFRVHEPRLDDAKKYEALNTEGDKTVPIKSLRYCEKFRGPNVIIQSYQGYSHTMLIKKGIFHDYVVSVAKQAQPYP